MTRAFSLTAAALFVVAGSAAFSPSASAQLGKFCGGYAGVGKVNITEGPGHRTSYSVLMINEQGRGSSFTFAFEPMRPTQGKPAARQYVLKPKGSVMIDLGSSVDVKPLTQEEVMRSIRVTNCKVDSGGANSLF